MYHNMFKIYITHHIHLVTISQETPQRSITKISWNITHLKVDSNYPGANRLSIVKF